jgi:hypothetical protein
LGVAGRYQELDRRTPQFKTRAHILGGKARNDDLDAGEQSSRLVARLARRKGVKFRILLETRTHGASPVSTTKALPKTARVFSKENIQKTTSGTKKSTAITPNLRTKTLHFSNRD